MSISNCCCLTCIQISEEAGQMVWYSHLFQNFPEFIVIHTVKDFGIVNKAEIDVFLELSCFFNYPVDVGNLISGSSVFSKTSLNIWTMLQSLVTLKILCSAWSVNMMKTPTIRKRTYCSQNVKVTSIWPQFSCIVPDNVYFCCFACLASLSSINFAAQGVFFLLWNIFALMMLWVIIFQ